MVSQAVRRIAIRLEGELKKMSPVNNGQLRQSIKVIPNEDSLTIKMNEHGKWVEFGTPPHVIKPKTKKALKFQSNGDSVIVKKVKHPGTRPNPFIRNTIKTKLPRIIAEELARE